jgi:pyruvate-formate lyase-activating enzyme
MGDLAPERPPGRTADRILNWDALREAFRASPHEHLFESRRRGVRHPGFCPRPFESITIDADGRLRMCCEDWLPTPIGDVRAGSLLGQWNSPAAMAIRESVLDGSYRFCDASRCPDLVKGTLPPLGGPLKAKHRDIVERGRTWLETPPTHLSLGYDQTCNLKCPTCRNDFIVLKGEGFAHAERIQAEVIETLLPGAREVIVTGQGDAIASRLFRRFLRELDAARYPHLRLLLMTNGLTLNSTMWDSFRSAQPAIAGVSISVDAASATTYAINRGGNFESLLKNLRFLGTLKRDGKIDFLELSFVVQANNAHEMPAFVRLARALGCDSVLFMKLIHWPGTFPEEEWSLRAVHEQQHPLHGTFLETLRHPDLQWEGVDLSNLADLDPSNAPQAEVSHG